MSRYTDISVGGSNDFEIKDIDGYKNWKDALDAEESCSFLLHEQYSKDKKELTVYVGWGNSKDLLELSTSINHFNPEDEEVLSFWSGLSLFTKEPIELLQTDEEWPGTTKAFGDSEDNGAWRLWAYEGKVIVQALGFKVMKTETHVAKNLLSEELLEMIKSSQKTFCDHCKTQLNLLKFDFSTRGYYKEVNAKTNYTQLCQKCYESYKAPFAEIKKLEEEITNKQKAIELLRGKK